MRWASAPPILAAHEAGGADCPGDIIPDLIPAEAVDQERIQGERHTVDGSLNLRELRGIHC